MDNLTRELTVEEKAFKKMVLYVDDEISVLRMQIEQIEDSIEKLRNLIQTSIKEKN